MTKFTNSDIRIELKKRLGWTDYEVYPRAVLVVHEMERDNPLFYEDGILYLPERTCKFIPFVEDDGSVIVSNCSECGCVALTRCEYNYCPNCGAKVME